MAIRTIRLFKDEILRKKSKEVKIISDKIKILLDDMEETMRLAKGVGLAAPQVGVLKRIFIVDIGEGLYEFINPEIVEIEGNQIESEGCLSVPGETGYVERPWRVKIKALDRDGVEFELDCQDFLAIAICHEYDHLDGVLYTDKVIPEDELEFADDDLDFDELSEDEFDDEDVEDMEDEFL